MDQLLAKNYQDIYASRHIGIYITFQEIHQYNLRHF